MLVVFKNQEFTRSSLCAVCRTVYDIATTQECKVVQEKECTTVAETKVRVEYHEHCHTVNEKQCKPTVRKVPEQVCDTTYAEECVNEAHTVVETGYVDECQDIKTEVSFPHLKILSTRENEKSEVCNCASMRNLYYCRLF